MTAAAESVKEPPKPITLWKVVVGSRMYSTLLKDGPGGKEGVDERVGVAHKNTHTVVL